MGKGREKTEGPQALTKSSCGVVGVKAQCAFKLLSKTDLNGVTCGSAKTSVLAIWETDQQSIIFILPVFIIQDCQKHGPVSSASTGYFFVRLLPKKQRIYVARSGINNCTATMQLHLLTNGICFIHFVFCGDDLHRQHGGEV